MSDRNLDVWIAENIIDKAYFHLPPEYTSDMNEAVKVLPEIGILVDSLRFDDRFTDTPEWSVGYMDSDGAWEGGPKCANPAMAICLAAYKLKTGEDWK